MMVGSNSYNYLEDYLLSVRAKGRYSVTLKELIAVFPISLKALHQSIFRVKSKNIIAQIRKGFYVIIPPEYSQQGMLPVYLFADDLMLSLNRDYYFGLFSAAAIHGAGHQQPMGSQIITKIPALRNIRNDKLTINFYTRSKWNAEGIIEKKTDAGYIKVSSAELTALDLIFYSAKIGGMNRLLPILEELSEIMKPSKLYKEAQFYGQIASVQRLGYLLEKVLQNTLLSDALKKYLAKKVCYFIPLSTAHKNRESVIDYDWKILVNINLER
jgi:predicted transcriptional regulator of viral defense system